MEENKREAFRKIQKQEREADAFQLASYLDQQLGLCANQIEQEYDRNYYYLGQRFAQGDCKSSLWIFLLPITRHFNHDTDTELM